MAVIKCKMCGGDLVIEEGSNVAECEYCGTKQTVPTVDNEKKLTLFARAGRLLRDCEFDKASGVFESIVAEFPEEAEAYWGLVLCKYGIEYVDDPATGKKVPTCHRSSFDSVMDDKDFENVMSFADIIARRVYREEAKQIEELRKAIIEVSGKEEPYDIFISYKETDDRGDRTLDSVIAQDIYTELTSKGYRVFFSRISLEDKLGTEYEPYIFAALNSAKVMLSVGTDYDYFNAVWVKNEWSRFLSLITKGEKKVLIPVFKNIDAYDMPKEFARLSAQDMGKIGAMQDLLRGVEKILGGKKEEATAAPQQVVQTIVQSANGVTTASLLERGMIFLEDGDWSSADEYFNKVLDIEPKNAQAYLGKLMAELHVRRQADLKDRDEPFDDRSNYLKAVRFGDASLKAELEADNMYIRDRSENAHKDAIYISAKAKMTGDIKDNYTAAIELFHKIAGWRDTDELIIVCQNKIEHIKARKEAERIETARLAAERKKKLKIAAIIAAAVAVLATVAVIVVSFIGKMNAYKSAEALLESGDEVHAAMAFGKLGSYSDAHERSLALWDEVAVRETISAGNFKLTHTVGMKANGMVIAAGNNSNGQCNVSGWKDIVAVSAGHHHTVGLKADGTVVATGENDNGQCNVIGWKDIVAISAGGYHTVGLKSDGTVVAVGENDDGQCDVSGWKDIVAISAGGYHTVGLKSDGTVIAVGINDDGRCKVSGWTDIVAISAGAWHTVGLKSDGTLITVGDNDCGQRNVSNWRNIVSINAGASFTVGLKSDGTVLETKYTGGIDSYDSKCNVSSWTDIVAISAGGYHAVGLKSDGTVVATGRSDDGECNVSGWGDIKLPAKRDD